MEITDHQLMGNQAELFVSFILSKNCLIRPVTSGTDIGVDLYCELLMENHPHLHFWIQVKSSSNFKLNRNGQAAFTFKTKHLNYWSLQPVPVFAFLANQRDLSNTKNYKIFVIDITEQLLNLKIKDQVTQTLFSDFTIENDTDLENFLTHGVEVTTARQKLNEGIIAPSHSTRYQYVKRVFPEGSSQFSEKILWSIRATTAFIIEDLIIQENQQPENDFYKKKRSEFTAILEAFRDRKNWEVHYFLGRSYLLDGHYLKAKERFEQSLHSIESDKNLIHEDWESTKQKILSFIKETESNIEKDNLRKDP